ncbi:hypothetical protein [Cohnella sp. WQ 127256]|uniref:hypothetical protein n=1 Tax=Cohnella sp. WQ 127256 TaxID=2938790 RepID=UPI0021185C55|nr:hypothetical protein [Cohnella sp. WQ 127256]
METYDLAELVIAQAPQSWSLAFSSAKLMIIKDHGTLQWFIDIDGVVDVELLHNFALSDHIGIEMRAIAIGGLQLEGKGHFHPNPQHNAAAIRGDGPLEGYAL